MIDFGKVTTLSNGVQLLNCTPHAITFKDGEAEVTVEPCGAKINARAEETEVERRGSATLVKTSFVQTEQGLAELAEITSQAPDALVVGSIISAQAYPGRVVGMTAAPGFERVPPTEKRMSCEKFTTF